MIFFFLSLTKEGGARGAYRAPGGSLRELSSLSWCLCARVPMRACAYARVSHAKKRRKKEKSV